MQLPSVILTSNALEFGHLTRHSLEVCFHCLECWVPISLINPPRFRAISDCTFQDDGVIHVFGFVGYFPTPEHRIELPYHHYNKSV